MKISASGLDFIKGFESFVGYVYDDLVPPVRGKYKEWDGGEVRGTLTIGYGHTDAAKHPLKISKGLKISEAEACEILDVDLDDCEEAVRRNVSVPLSQGRFDSLCSFAFNCGEGNLKNITKRVNRGDDSGARRAFDLYVKSKGQTLRGLQRRRDGEQALWDSVPTPPITKDDTFHPAEVDVPVLEKGEEKISIPDLVKAGSRTMNWLNRIQIMLFGTGVGTAGLLSADKIETTKGHIHALKDILSDHAGLLILAGLAAGYFLSQMAQNTLVAAANDGRYEPRET